MVVDQPGHPRLRELGLLSDSMVEKVVQAALAREDDVVDREAVAEIAASVILTSAGKSALASLGALPIDQGTDRVH